MNSCLQKINEQYNCNHSIVWFPATVCHLVEKLHFYACLWPFHKCEVAWWLSMVKHYTLPFTFLKSCARMVATLWHLQSSWSWECMSSACIWSPPTPLPTPNSCLTASKSFCHITSLWARLDRVSSSLQWGAWQSENPHFLSQITAFILFKFLVNDTAQGNILDITAAFMLM